MTEITLQLTAMAHGGSALGRDDNGRFIFVPYAIPGETVRVRLQDEKKEYGQAELVSVETAVAARQEPRCPHFGTCGGCHFQHMLYETQLDAKREVTRDQLRRLGGIPNAPVLPVLPNPQPWGYRQEISLSPVPGGGLGYWSPRQRQVIAIDTCPIAAPPLLDLLHDIDMELPGLRKMTLRLGADDALLAALVVDDVEPPELETDFPVSVAIVLPDNTAASLVGDHFTVQTVNGRDFRVSPGCLFPPSAAASLVADVVAAYASREPEARVVQAYSGVGWLTAFLAPVTAGVIAIEPNPDAVADAAVNLDECDNVHIYEGDPAAVLAMLDVAYDVLVVEAPANGLSRQMMGHIRQELPPWLVYVSSDVATMARDGKQLARAGYRLVEVQPIDMQPQTFHVDTVSLWWRPEA